MGNNHKKSKRLFEKQQDGSYLLSCNKCNAIKPSIDFYVKYKNRPATDLSHWQEKCIECAKAFRESHYKKNKEKINKITTARYYANREKYLAQQNKRKLEKSKNPIALIRHREVHNYEPQKRYLHDRLRFWIDNAKRRDYSFLLSLDDILLMFETQKGLCYYTKLPLFLGPNSSYTISLDRKNSDIGYEKSNSVLCCSVVNKAKQSLSLDDFKGLAEALFTNKDSW